MLGDVDNTSDLDKPISIATQNALNRRLSKDDPYVQSINAEVGNVIINKATIGLGSVDNTSDLNKVISISTQTALDTKVNNTTFDTYKSDNIATLGTKVNKSSIAVSNGVASLDGTTKVPLTQIPILTKDKVPNAQIADKFANAVVVTLADDVTGSVTLDGSNPTLTLNTTLKNSGVIAGSYGSSVSVGKITVDVKGRITSAENLSIPTSSTTTSGLVRLNDTTTSLSTTEAATARTVKVVYDIASEALSTTLKNTQRGTPNGVASLDANGRVPVAQLPETGLIVADRLSNLRSIKTTGDATWTVSFNGSADVTAPITLSTVLTTPGSFGTATQAPSITVDGKGRITGVSLTKITPSFTDVTSKPTTVAGYGITDTYTKTQTDNADKATLGIAAPVGMVMHYASRNAPTGWLECSGQAVDRTIYAALFSVIGTTFGSGNGTTTFNLPDLRGEFIRGWDNSRGVDSSRALGTNQSDQFKEHTHKVKEGSVHPNWITGKEVIVSGDDFTQAVSYESTTSVTGGYETRPRNIALLACIKY